MTCRCAMCGDKKAGKIARGSYIRSGIRCDEHGLEGMSKRKARKLRRVREKNSWLILQQRMPV